jgi:hypothetical protein
MDIVSQVQVQCPFCWETVQFTVDASFGNYEEVIDCPVCCRPMVMCVTVLGEEGVSVIVEP